MHGSTCDGCGACLVDLEWIPGDDARELAWSRCPKCNTQTPECDWHSIGDPCPSCGAATEPAR